VKVPEIGDYVRCLNGHHGIVTKIAGSPLGTMIYIIESDGRIYHFPLDMLYH
jgi:hypothetical protein